MGVTDDAATLAIVSRAAHDAFLAIVYYGTALLAARLLHDYAKMTSAEFEEPTGKRIRVVVLLIGNGWSLCGLDGNEFTRWIMAESHYEVEKKFVERLFGVCWTELRKATTEMGWLFDKVDIRFERSPGKRASSRGMFHAKPYNPQEAIDRPWQEVVGLELQAPSGTRIPGQAAVGRRGVIPLGGDKDFQTPAFVGTWGMPQVLVDRLAGIRQGPRSLADKVNDLIMSMDYKQDDAGKYYLGASPLKLLLERHLLASLKETR
jgi:hypothetical protein